MATQGPNPRPPFATVGAVTDVFVSAGGRVLAATTDTGSSVPSAGAPGPSQPTWYVWARNGTQLAMGGIDVAGCSTRVGDLCQSSAATAAISSDGTRIAVGGAIALSPVDMQRGILYARTLASTTGVMQTFSNPVQKVAISATGGHIAVLERVAAVAPGDPDTARISLYTFDGTTLTAVIPPTAIAAPATAVALAPDGKRLAVAADKLYMFSSTAPTTVDTVASITGPVASVAVAGAAHKVLAGYTSGAVALFDDTQGTSPRASVNLGVSAAAVAHNATAAWVGAASGKVYLYDILDASPFLRLRVSRQVTPDAIQQLTMSADGTFALARSATQVHLLQALPKPTGNVTGTGNFTDLWSHPTTTPSVGGGVDAVGDLAAVGIGSGVVAFDASHAVVVQLPASLAGPPRVTRDFEVVVLNNGNRAEHVELGAWFPAKFFLTLDGPAAFDLRPGQSVRVPAHLVIGEDLPPGVTTLYVNATGPGFPAFVGHLRVEVLQRDAVSLDVDGQASVSFKRGASHTFLIRIKNHGNAPVSVDTQASLDDTTWTLRAPLQHFDLAPGAGGQFNVTLTAPASAPDGDQARVTLQLAGRPGSQVTLTGVVGARPMPEVKMAGLVSMPAGQESGLAVTVRNVGNVADRFRLDTPGLPSGWVATIDGQDAVGWTTELIEPGLQVGLDLRLTPPAGAAGLTVGIKVKAQSTLDPALTSEDSTLVQVVAVPESTKPNPLPAWGTITAIALAGLLTAWRRSGRHA